jgi:hypothetical protein
MSGEISFYNPVAHWLAPLRETTHGQIPHALSVNLRVLLFLKQQITNCPYVVSGETELLCVTDKVNLGPDDHLLSRQWLDRSWHFSTAQTSLLALLPTIEFRKCLSSSVPRAIRLLPSKLLGSQGVSVRPVSQCGAQKGFSLTSISASHITVEALILLIAVSSSLK